MPLYEVTLEGSLMVLAKNIAEAENVAVSYASEVMDWGTSIHEIQRRKYLPREWVGCIPFSEDASEDKTCDQILDDLEDQRRARAEAKAAEQEARERPALPLEEPR